MNVLLIQIDGKIPNLALMRIAAHHRHAGDVINFRWGVPRGHSMFDEKPDAVYASAIFKKSQAALDLLFDLFPTAIVGGTGSGRDARLEDIGVLTQSADYSLYPKFQQSIGFTQRGCRLKCPFCVVPAKEGAIQSIKSIWDIWRGDPWPRELLLLDNDFFGSPQWQRRIAEIRDGAFKVSFNQGINARFLTDEAASAIASVDYRDDSMKVKRIYTAWDNRRDERTLMRGLGLLAKHGVKPDHIMVYMLIGYWPNETDADWEYRRKRLREFGARPYPMPFNRTSMEAGFQRFCVGAYDKRFSWDEFKKASFRPERLATGQESMFLVR